jgi:uncharacterized protein
MTAHPTQSNPTPPVIDRPGTASASRSLDALILEVTHRLVQEFNPENIFLFGSHVWGVPHADSDLDLLVIIPTSQISSSKRSSIAYRCLRDILYPLDILVKTRQEVEKNSQVSASLEHQILSKGKCLYEQ